MSCIVELCLFKLSSVDFLLFIYHDHCCLFAIEIRRINIFKNEWVHAPVLKSGGIVTLCTIPRHFMRSFLGTKTDSRITKKTKMHTVQKLKIKRFHHTVLKEKSGSYGSQKSLCVGAF